MGTSVLVRPTADQTFERLFRADEQKLLRYCRSIVRDDHDARDALQNTAAQALVGMRSDQVRIDARAWLFRIARNESLQVLRRRRPAASLSDHEVIGGADPESIILAREEFAELVADIGSLTSHARQALLLREAHGLSYEQIADVLETTPAAARQSVYEGRAALRADREARTVDCATIRDLLSHPDGRRRRCRSATAHLRACASCQAWSSAALSRPRRLLLAPVLVLLSWLRWLLPAGRLEALLAWDSTPRLLTRGLAALVVAGVSLPAAHAVSGAVSSRVPTAIHPIVTGRADAPARSTPSAAAAGRSPATAAPTARDSSPTSLSAVARGLTRASAYRAAPHRARSADAAAALPADIARPAQPATTVGAARATATVVPAAPAARSTVSPAVTRSAGSASSTAGVHAPQSVDAAPASGTAQATDTAPASSAAAASAPAAGAGSGATASDRATPAPTATPAPSPTPDQPGV